MIFERYSVALLFLNFFSMYIFKHVQEERQPIITCHPALDPYQSFQNLFHPLATGERKSCQSILKYIPDTVYHFTNNNLICVSMLISTFVFITIMLLLDLKNCHQLLIVT